MAFQKEKSVPASKPGVGKAKSGKVPNGTGTAGKDKCKDKCGDSGSKKK